MPNMPAVPAQMFLQPFQLWTQYWMNLSKMMWSSGDVIARRGMLYAETGTAGKMDPNFDRMASEKGNAAVEAWTEMAAKTMQLAPMWGMNLWTNALTPRSSPQAMGNLMARTARDNTVATLRVVNAGMKPVQRQVSANVKRLSKAKKKR